MLLRHLLEDEHAGPITPANVDGKYKVGKVLIDNIHGLGATPNNGNVHYMGFVAFIKPSDFLHLARYANDREERSHKLEPEALKQGIGCPFLIVAAENEKAPWGQLRITGHEGRTRMNMVKRVNGDDFFPVHFFPRLRLGELRARHLDQAFFEGLKTVVTEAGSPYKLDVRKVFCNGKEYHL